MAFSLGEPNAIGQASPSRVTPARRREIRDRRDALDARPVAQLPTRLADPLGSAAATRTPRVPGEAPAPEAERVTLARRSLLGAA